MFEDLSQKEIDILNFLDRSIRNNRYPPSYREICSALDISSTSTVYSVMQKLETKGYIRRDSSKNRAVEIISSIDMEDPTKKETFDVPLLGNVAAGQPILAIENVEDTYPLPIELSSKGQLFMLRVQGESMIDIGMYNGDKIIVRQQNTANNGEIVVAMIDESATVKRFYKHADHIELRPENSSMCPIIVKDTKILGKVIGLIRMIN